MLQKGLLDIEGAASTPVELAAGLREFVKAGKTADEVISGGLLPTMSKFATVAELGLAKGIQLAITQVNAFGVVTERSTGQILDYAAAADMMAEAVFSAPISFEDLQQSLKHTTELATTVGASFDEVTTALSLMGEAGIKGSQAGTALRTGLTKLMAPTGAVADTMKSLGANMAEAFDPDGTINVKKALDLFSGAFVQLDKMSQVKFAKDVFGLRAQKIITLVANLDEWDERNKAILGSAGQVEEAYSNIDDTVQVASKRFAAAFSRELIEDMLPAMDTLGKGIAAAVEYADEMVAVLGEATKAALLFAAVWAGSALLGGISSVVTSIGGIAIGLQSALGASVALKLSLGQVAAVAGTLYAGFKFGEWLNQFEKVRGIGIGFVDIMAGGAITIEFAFKRTWAFMADGFDIAVDSMRRIYIKFIEGVLELSTFKVNFPGLEPKEFSVLPEGVSRNLESFRDMLGKSGGAVEELKIKLTSLNEQEKSAKAIHESVITSMKEESKERGNLSKANLDYYNKTGQFASKEAEALGITQEAYDSINKSNEAYFEQETKTNKARTLAAVGTRNLADETEAAAAAKKAEAEALKEAEKAQKAYAKQQEKIAEATRDLNRAIEDVGFDAYKESLTGTAKIYAEISGKVETYREKLEDQGTLTEENAVLLGKYEQSLIAAAKANGSLAKASNDFVAGFKAGLQDIKKEMLTVGQIGADMAKTLHGATSDTLATTLKSVTHGLSQAKKEIKTGFNDSLVSMTEAHADAMKELDIQYDAGELSAEEFEKNKLELVKDYNEDRVDLQAQYAKDIKTAEDQLAIDITDIWLGVFDKLLEAGSQWATDMLFTLGENLVTDLTGTISSAGGAVGSLLSGDYAGAAKAAGGLFGKKQDVIDVYVVNLGEGGAFGGAADKLKDAAGTLLKGSSDLGSTAASIGDAVGSSITSGGALSSVGNAALYAEAAVKAVTSGVGTAGTWYAGAQASQMGVSAGSQLALIEGTFGPAMEAAVTTGVEAGMTSGATTTAIAEGAGGAGVGGGAAAGAAGIGALLAAVYIGSNANELFNLGSTMVTGTTEAASGNILELTSIAGSMEEAADKFDDPAWVDAQLDAVQQWGQNTVEAVGGRSALDTEYVDSIAGAFDAMSSDMADFVQTEAGPEQYKEIMKVADSLSSKLHNVYTALEIESEQYGDEMATLALQMGDSTEAFDNYTDAVAGQDVALETSTKLMELASSAAAGNATSYRQLITSLEAQGLSTEAASQAANEMMAVMANSSVAIDTFNDSLDEIADKEINVSTESGAVKAFADGGMLPSGAVRAFADGGMLQGGTGMADDLYMGKVNGAHVLAKGGEYFMPPEQTAKYFPMLEAMRTNKFANGGALGVTPGTSGAPNVDMGSFWDQVFEDMASGWQVASYQIGQELFGVFEMAGAGAEKIAVGVESINMEYQFLEAKARQYGVTQEKIDLIRQARAQEIANLYIEQDKQHMAAMSTIFETLDMDTTALQMKEVSYEFDELKKQLISSGGTAAELTLLEKARAQAMEDVAEEQAKLLEQEAANIEDFLDSFKDIIATENMSDYEKQIYALNDRYDDAIERAEELGLTTDDLALIETARQIELDALAKATENLTESTAETFTNLADVLKEAETYGLQGAVVGGVQYHADGGIATTAHVFGEAGVEALIPLPYGPNMLSDIYDSTVNGDSGRPLNIQVFVGNKELESDIRIVADDVAYIRQDRNVQGRLYQPKVG